MEGWIKLYRQMTSWAWYKDKNAKIVFLHLLLIANHKTKTWQGLTIKRGQVVISYRTLADDLGLTLQEVRTAISKLIATHEITQEATHQYSLVTLVNYDKFQCEEKIATHQSTHELTTTNNIYKNNIYDDIGKVIQVYQNEIGFATPNIVDTFNSYKDDITTDMMIKAINIASERNAKNMAYIKTIMNNWIAKGFKTLADTERDFKPMPKKKTNAKIISLNTDMNLSELYEN